MQILFIFLALLALAIGLIRHQHSKPKNVPQARKNKTVAGGAAPSHALPDLEVAAPPSDVQFRPRGARGDAGPVFGDVLCSDGVYLPQVWESDFHTSFDGRWIRTGSYGDSTPRLLDRKSQRCWLLTVAQASAVDDLHWRLPRWNGQSTPGNGVALDARKVFSEGEFEAWLSQHVTQAAQALVSVCDLWIPADCVPAQAQAPVPVLAQPEGGPVQVSLQRYWPQSLRSLPDPLEPLLTPYWQIYLNGEVHSWLIRSEGPLVWRADGMAFACYGFALMPGVQPTAMRLGIWSLEGGGLQWSETKPADHKAWEVQMLAPDAQQAPLCLVWDGDVLLQRMEIDSPQLERLHDGRHVLSTLGPVFREALHTHNGLVRTRSLPMRQFFWRRDLTQPLHWQAQSDPVAGHCLIWNLVHEAASVPGATAGYTLSWGEQQLAGVWELEHVIVEGQWALLFPWTDPALQGGKAVPWVWDGQQLSAIEIPHAMVRMRAHVQPGRAQVLVLVGCGPDSSNCANTGMWRWPLQVPDASNLAKANWAPAYEWRDLAVDAQGQWQLQPRWREVQRIQHPCADGDYVWRYSASNDALWWWGGLHSAFNNHWAPEAARCEGVMLTQSGVALCGTGPAACPHPMGDGWLVLEWLARGTEEKNYWKLHWLRPGKHEIRTMPLRAYMPVIRTWDAAQGIVWIDAADPQDEADASAGRKEHIVPDYRWEAASLEVLKSVGAGLWMRKQDVVYADAILLREDCPWPRKLPQPLVPTPKQIA